jgi:hypothetical protein
MNSDPHSPQPPEYAVEMAYALAESAAERDIDYEEYTFEIENGPDDGMEIKILVIRV